MHMRRIRMMVIIMDMQRRHIQRLKNFPREQRTQDCMVISGGNFNEGAEVLLLTRDLVYTKGLLTLLTHRETSEAPAYFYRSCGRHP